ncbi:YicC/YloC family endoribonuclease [uncultured Microscilla sp.]|uniref:YicC/YloC family endoribonuclease n=1 Tax=uncultured Microscilla sp. TaxID=432653 RepID=UPI002619DA08|nr:YicC/YloC family endoribonuclease [uncultured Microscilla sp.]
MIQSMTGFGSATHENDRLTVYAEIKTLNSKYLDVNVRIPRMMSAEKELILRELIKNQLRRGKTSVLLEFQFKDTSVQGTKINPQLAKGYYNEMLTLAGELGAPEQDIFRMTMMMPDVQMQNMKDDLQDDDWKVIKTVFEQAIEKCQNFRRSEGETLLASFHNNISIIKEKLELVKEQDPKRVIAIKERIAQHMEEINNNDNFDKNRFEQEMVYYIEKLDISEEKVRLQSHLDYLEETLSSSQANGKKLNFIAQEIGREINTIGSKANDAVIQRYVVEMKEELEKIKEQVLNVL